MCCLVTMLSIQHIGTNWPEAFPCWLRVELVHVNVGGWLIVADIAVNISLFWVVVVNGDHGERVLFFR